jgi:hypothetical protein
MRSSTDGSAACPRIHCRDCIEHGSICVEYCIAYLHSDLTWKDRQNPPLLPTLIADLHLDALASEAGIHHTDCGTVLRRARSTTSPLPLRCLRSLPTKRY